MLQCCALVWDMGASFGLTPFRGNILDYVECEIAVRNIAHENMIVGVCATLHKFQIDGEDIFLPCLSYHSSSAEVRLFSLQTYHTLYCGHTVVGGDKVETFLDHLKIGVGIDQERSNLPMVHNCAVSAQEMKEHGPHIRSALPQYKRQVDFLGGWSDEHFKRWKLSTIAVEQDFGHYCCGSAHATPNVAIDANVNLSSAQKELLLWHWKLGIGCNEFRS